MAWLGMLITLGWNYREHRRGRPTICSVTRRVLPRPAFLVAGLVGAVALGVHVWRGYVVDFVETLDVGEGKS